MHPRLALPLAVLVSATVTAAGSLAAPTPSARAAVITPAATAASPASATGGTTDPTTTPDATTTPATQTTRALLVQRYTVRGTSYRTAGQVSTPPHVRARSWAVADLDTGRVIAVHRHRAHLPQASTIKLLTAVTAADTVVPYPAHRVTWSEAHPQYCTCAGLKVGRRYSRTALMAGMLLPSGNDAALALAGAAGHGHAWFVHAMNVRARELGATDTVVVTPNGLTAPGAHSSARDLLIFLRAAQADPVVEPVLELAAFRLGPLGGRTHLVWRRTDYVNKYVATNPGTQGKSGYTTPAKNTLVVGTPIGGHRIGVATLGAPSGYSTSGARRLTLWANRNFELLEPVGQLPAVPAPDQP